MKFFQKYKVEFLFLLLQIIDPISLLGLFLCCIYLFYKVSFKRNLDLVSVFILLIPSIVLANKGIDYEFSNNEQFSNNWIQLYLPKYYSSYLVGPVSFSVPFLAALAIPVRLIYFLKFNRNKFLVSVWLLILTISIIGLVWAVLNRQESTGGLTVGFRIALTIGAVLLPLTYNPDNFESQLITIIKISLVFFLLGLNNGLWKFITFAFPSFLIFSNENKKWKLIGFLSFLIMIIFDFTFTLKLTALFSFIFLLFYKRDMFTKVLLKIKISRYFLLLFPILVMLYFVDLAAVEGRKSFILFSEFFSFKLFEDRVPLWKYTIDLISNSNFFLVPAARDIVVYDYTRQGEDSWGVGAHNIFLEIARQLGLFSTILIAFIIGFIFLNIVKMSKVNDLLSKAFLALFSVYLVWGLTGNALIYESPGILYWLILGQLYQVISFQRKKQVIFSNEYQ